MSDAARPTLRSSSLGYFLLGVVLFAVCLPELILQMADQGLIGSRRWRWLAYQNGALWPGLLRDWQPNFPNQPISMFVTYAGLHVGLSHLVSNVAALAWLFHLNGPISLRGAVILIVAFLGSTLGAALGFILFSPGTVSVVGASGAVFGIAGASIIWRWKRQTASDAPRATLEAFGLWGALMALNALSGALYDGSVAWEAHLGGAVAGALLAFALPSPARRISG